MTLEILTKSIEICVPQSGSNGFDTENVYIHVQPSALERYASNATVLSEQPPANISEAAEAIKAAVDALNTYAAPVICVLGIIGDITSFLIFVCTSFRYQPCSQLLAALTLVDTLFLLSRLISFLMTYFPVLALAPGNCSVMVYMSYVCSFLSVWFVVFMMVERYIVVCHPFRASTTCNKKKSAVMVSAMAVLSLIFYSHSFFTTSKSDLGSPCIISDGYYKFVSIVTYIDTVLAFVIPFLALVWLNLRIIFTVRKFRLQHNRLNHSIRRLQRYNKTLSLAQVRSTKMLIWVSSVFIILHLPSYVVRLYGLILEQVNGQLGETSQFWFNMAQQICQFLYHVNFAIDFIVYVISSNNFRRNVSRCIKNMHPCQRQFENKNR